MGEEEGDEDEEDEDDDDDFDDDDEEDADGEEGNFASGDTITFEEGEEEEVILCEGKLLFFRSVSSNCANKSSASTKLREKSDSKVVGFNCNLAPPESPFIVFVTIDVDSASVTVFAVVADAFAAVD